MISASIYLKMSTKRQPVYLEIAGELEREIASLTVNCTLPTEQQLAKKFSVSRVTIRRALEFIQRQGLITRQRGRGTIVSPPKITRNILPVSTIEGDLQKQGLKVETRLIEWRTGCKPPEFIQRRLQITPRVLCGLVRLTRLIDDRIICYDERYIPSAWSRRLSPDLMANYPTPLLLEKLARTPITLADWVTEITAAPLHVAAELKIVPRVLIVTNTFTHYFRNGRPAEAGVTSYRIDRVKFRFVASARFSRAS